MRDLIYLWDVIFDIIEPCTCGTINPTLYDDPGLPDTVWVESKTLIVGISSPICIGVINDEPLPGMALALEWDGTAALEWDRESWPIHTERIDSIIWFFSAQRHADGVNPDTLLFHSFITSDTIPLAPGRDAVCCPYFIPQSAGTATFSLVSWVNAGQSMLVTEDHAAILPTFYGGNITVLAYLTGDPNHDGIIDIADVVYLINYLFADGPEPDPYESGNTTCEGEVNIADVIFLINYLFVGGPLPSC